MMTAENPPSFEENAEELYENAPCGYLSAMPDGRIMRVNQTFLNLTGHTREELLAGRRLQELMTVPGRVFYDTHFAPLLRMQGFVKEIACDLLRPGSTPLPVLLNAVQVLNASGQPAMLRITVFDATERRRYEGDLLRARQKAERYAAIVHASADAILSVGADGTVHTWNAGAEQLLGYSAAEAVGREIRDFIVPESVEEIGELLTELRSGHAVWRETVCSGRFGKRVEVAMTLTPHIEPPGELTAVSAILTDISDRKRSEESLQYSEQLHRLAFDLSPTGMAYIDSESRFIRVNEIICRITGYTAAELLTMKVAELTHPDDQLRDSELITRFLQGGADAKYENEKRYVRKDGGIRWVAVTARAVTDIAGRLLHTIGVVQDITERRQTEKTIQESHQRFRGTFENAAVGVAHVAPDGKWLQVNARLCELTGYERSELLTKTFQDITHPDDLDADMAHVQRLLAGEAESYSMEKRYFRKVGSVVWVNLTVSCMRTAEGAVDFFITVVEDISERKQAERELHESEARYRALTEASATVVWRTTADGEVIFSSNTWYEITGQTEAEKQGWGWLQAIHPDDRDRTISLWLQSLNTKTIHENQFRVRTHDGTYRWFSVRGVPICNADGTVREWVGANTDFHDRKMAEEELRRLAAELSNADRRKDEFLATLAHELRNPLAPIRNGLQLMRLNGGSSEAGRQSLEIMDRQLTQMVRLVDDLMDVSRISTGKVELRKIPVPLADILNSAVETSRPLIEQMGHELRISLPEYPVIIHADMTRMAQVFLNLLNNAAKYSDQGGCIRLTAEQHDTDVIVSVRDTGIGIAADQLPHIFEMFAQVDHSLEKSQGGLGIGLSLVKRLVAMHGGSVMARSEGEGMGSEFIVRLPVEINSAVEGEKSASQPEQDSIPPLRILIVDDNRDSADSLSMVLKIMGNDTRTAYDGEEAVAAAAEFCPRVILLDIGLPKLNGYATCRRIREQKDGMSMVIIAQTGWGQADDRQRTRDAGFDHHLVKPVDLNELQKLLAELQATK